MGSKDFVASMVDMWIQFSYQNQIGREAPVEKYSYQMRTCEQGSRLGITM